MKSGGNLQDLETIWFYNGDVQGRLQVKSYFQCRIQVRIYYLGRIKVDPRY